MTFTFYLCIMRPFKDSMTNAVAITGEIFMLIFYSIMIIYHFGIVDTGPGRIVDEIPSGFPHPLHIMKEHPLLEG